ncbi:hypothetical protein HMPREF0063_10063 [Aeromicrobium marinum DSM 15272]|uniref:Uncharacterized protein n=1 Tax=Aeromicrobium marinum DSM 15272 TaxID=585531 RepID=E2S7Q6_9ACTN|nr:phage portal protein [Aeromicrobium marinum]EFQ84722.1 hypothetical protein HMPREF0063_10063 [Aeromicrobium marinum DSM 15272]
MDLSTALDRLNLGVAEIVKKRKGWDRREQYFRGDQDRPYAPVGVNEEYEALLDMSMANFLEIAMRAPIQRIAVDGFTNGKDMKPDKNFWRDVWQSNRMDRQQRKLYEPMMVHDFGVVGVWMNTRDKSRPIVRVENGRRVHLERDPQDPTRFIWAVKTYTERLREPSQLLLPNGAAVVTEREVAWVYDELSWARFYRENGSGMWKFEADGEHPLADVPFVPYCLNDDADGNLHPSIEPLMPQQDAINTIRFNTLLAMQFSAFRQRVFTGYDPVIKDANGQIQWRKNSDGSLALDAQGQPQPLLNTPGRIGVDRALVFPGTETKVFDLAESNLKNYIEVFDAFLTTFFATGHIPPQYQLNKMANLSGDAMSGAESTLQALIADIQQATGESHEQMAILASRAAGADSEDVASEVIWGDGEVRSFAQTVDAVVKLISIGFPRRAAFEMIPGATQVKVDAWMDQAEAEAVDPTFERMARDLRMSDGVDS